MPILLNHHHHHQSLLLSKPRSSASASLAGDIRAAGFVGVSDLIAAPLINTTNPIHPRGYPLLMSVSPISTHSHPIHTHPIHPLLPYQSLSIHHVYLTHTGPSHPFYLSQKPHIPKPPTYRVSMARVHIRRSPNRQEGVSVMRRPMGVRGRLGGWAGGGCGCRMFWGCCQSFPMCQEFSGRKRGVKYMGVLGFAQGLVGAGGGWRRFHRSCCRNRG